MKKEEAYSTLELNDSASESDIKKSFRSLAAKTHPDKNNNDPKAESKFKKINEAYQILTGKQKAEDDFPNPFGGGFSGFGGFDGSNINDFITDFFGGNKNKTSQQQVSDMSVNIKLSFKESVLGVNKSFSYLVKVHCVKCDGQGIDMSKTQRCKKCKGTGNISQTTHMGSFFRTVSLPCNECNGKGIVGEKCPTCLGNTFITKKKEVSLKIPPLGNLAKKFLIKNEGNEIGNIVGNVIVVVFPTIDGDDKFKGMMVDNRNIVSGVEISLDKLLFGGKLDVETIHGVKNIPIKKMTRPGDKITINNCGVNCGEDIYSKTFKKGHHIVIVQIKYPEKNKLTKELKEILEKLYSGE